jgi:hypothetical protein
LLEKFTDTWNKYLKEQWSKKSMDIAKEFIFFYLKKKWTLGENEEVWKEIYKVFSDFVVEYIGQYTHKEDHWLY